MKKDILLLAALLLGGCGSINTVLRGDDYSQRELRELKTHCETVPRIYSGVAYDFCSLHAEQDNRTDKSGPLLAGVLLDGAFSGVLDTLALPWTVYRQSTDGSLIIPRKWTPGAVR